MICSRMRLVLFFFFQAEDGIRDLTVTGVQTCALPILLMNLVINARDAISSGGRITLETRNIHLDALYARQHIGVIPGPYVQLTVSDTGKIGRASCRERW